MRPYRGIQLCTDIRTSKSAPTKAAALHLLLVSRTIMHRSSVPLCFDPSHYNPLLQGDGFMLSQGFNETQFLDAATGEVYADHT